MAAYASLVSLMTLIDHIQNHPNPPITLHPPHVESLCSHLTFFQQFLQLYSIGVPKELESRIADAAHVAEDVIETHIVDQIMRKNKKRKKRLKLRLGAVVQIQSTFRGNERHQLRRRVRVRVASTSADPVQFFVIRKFHHDLDKVILDLDCVKKEAVEIKGEIGIQDYQAHRPLNPNLSPSSSHFQKNDVVGFDDILIQLMDKLTGHPSSRQIIPIHGMGGIGKTTLARLAYENELIVEFFDVRSWITISQEYNVQEILSKIILCQKDREELTKMSDEELGVMVNKDLYGRRYLLIFDDIWSIEVWDKVKRFFPENNNGSRIVITTRLSIFASELCVGSENIKLDFLDEDKSWDLLCKSVFKEKRCPIELEEVGREIAQNCKGLPLSIVVIGGLLAKSKWTHEHWADTLENMKSALYLDDGEHCSQIIYTSYNSLPPHLKSCLLYMGAFREDGWVGISFLINLWVAEGFIQPIEHKSLEVAAREYLDELIDRNLILARGVSSRGRIKFCYTHDLVREFCIEVAQKEKFLCVVKKSNLNKISKCHRILVDESMSKEECLPPIIDVLQPAVRARSLLYNVYRALPNLPNRMLKVSKLNGGRDSFLYPRNAQYFSPDVFQLVNSRYLSFNLFDKILPSSICLHWNLCTLVISTFGCVEAPREIWKMHQLRHVKVRNYIRLPNPQIDEQSFEYVLSNLQTLSFVDDFKGEEEMFKRIPNVIELKCSLSIDNSFNNLNRLEKLESLSCYFPLPVDFRINFPISLKKLVLKRSKLNWEGISATIGSLPLLQVLKLKYDSIQGEKLVTVEGDFRCLRFLEIELCEELIFWEMESSHFPRLEHLRLSRLPKLKEIPNAVGEIATLHTIQVEYCSKHVGDSAMEIKKEQEDLGNVGLQVLVDEKMTPNEFREAINSSRKVKIKVSDF